MLSPKTQTNLANAKGYFEEHLCAGDYYAESGRVQGVWMGEGAVKLGLSGAVTRDAFVALCDNQHPVSGERLTQRHKTTRHDSATNSERANRRVFFDFTISPPKSVSIAALVANDTRIVEAHRAAVGVAMVELEQFAAARLCQSGANSDRRTGNIVAALFEHETSRALDPHLHTHCIVFNATHDDAEQRWKALENHDMMAAQKYVENVYYHELARALRGFGYTFINAARGDFELAEVSAELRERFSKRHRQIDEQTEEFLAAHPDLQGANVQAIREHLAHKARDRKVRGISKTQLRNYWSEQLTEAERAGLRLPTASQDVQSQGRIAVDAVSWAEEHLFERRSVVREHELWRHALTSARGAALTVTELKNETQSRAYLRAERDKVSRRDVLAREWAIVEAARDGLGRHAPLASWIAAEGSELAPDQLLAFRQILRSTDFITLFRGGAGTGKSFVLRRIQDALRRKGLATQVAAPQRQQVADLGRDGLQDAQTVPHGIYQMPEETTSRSVAPLEILAPDYVKENAFVLHDGVLTIRTGPTLTPIKNLPDETARRIRGLVKLRNAVRETLRTQLQDDGEDAVLDARRALNFQYDHFVSRFGAVNENANRRAFRGDPDLPLLCSLEDYNDETKKAVKTAIFRERTIHQPKAAVVAETAQDALVLALNETGRADLTHMEMLLRKPPAEFLPELKGMVYRNPQTERWETEDQYLSGDVRSKLEDARAAAAANPSYQENVTALEAVQPADLTPSEIDARLGAVWIPPTDVEAFARSLLGTEGVTVSHAAAVGTWFIRGDYNTRATVANTTEWGTARYSAIELIQDALNLKTPTVYDTDAKTDAPIINPQQTEAARDRMEKIKERFKSWIWEDDARRERLCRKYNDEFNSVRLRVFNGSHLTLPASSQQITLRPHQKNAIWRIVQSDNTLLAHAVGAGKTYTMVAAGIELKRLGLAAKPMFVVPNHMLAQFSSELLTLYPTANILVAGKEDFEAAKRARLFSRIATGNRDAVIVTHSSFEKIPVSIETRRAFIDEQLYEIERAIREQKGERGTRLVKELEKVKRRLTAKFEVLSAEHTKDNTLTFEELGIDRLFIDEAHKFKNLFYVTKMTRVAGLPQTASERAFDLFLKVQHIQGKNKGGGVVFATGTPISNTMAEMFTMQRYLQMGTLRRNQLQHFDSWAGTFGETVTAMELSPDGSGYRLQSRFARFVNVPELMQQFRQVADVQTAEMLKLPVPKMEQGRPITVSAPSSPELKRFVDQLVKRTEKIKSGKVDPRDDNMLKITTEGRKAALDLRLVLPHVRDNPDSKTNQAVERIHQVWLDSAASKGAQLVFCDMSTPQPGGRGFSVYDDVRTKLLARGIPSEEIAFIQDCNDDTAKASLFKNVREGKVRVLFGSTAKMGEGTNVQKRLVALHHLDAPWRPSDIEQRDGRILRQGNQNECVKVFRYVTEGSFDAYMWQTLETKCRFIAQVMNGDATVRRAEDVDAAALTYAEVKAIASGNPLVIEKAHVDAEVMRLTRLKKQHAESLYQMRYRRKGLGDNIQRCEREIASIREDLRTRISTRGDNFSMTVQKEAFTERVKAGRALVFLAAALKPFQFTKAIGEIGGFPISLHRFDERANLVIHGKCEYKANVSDSPTGTISSVEHALESMEDRLRERETDLKQAHKQSEDLTKQLDHPFEHEEKLTVATKRQQEIITALDITKNQASAKLDEGPEQSAESIDETPRHAARKKPAKTTSVAV